MKKNLLLLPILLLASAWQLNGIQCAYKTEQVTARDDASNNIRRYCHDSSIEAYEEWCKTHDKTPQDPQTMQEKLWSYERILAQKCWNARRALGVAKNNLNNHASWCQYHFNKKEGIHCSSECKDPHCSSPLQEKATVRLTVR